MGTWPNPGGGAFGGPCGGLTEKKSEPIPSESTSAWPDAALLYELVAPSPRCYGLMRGSGAHPQAR